MCILCVDSGRDRDGDGDGGDDDHDHDDDGNHEDLQAASIIIMLSGAALHNLIHLTT